LRSASCCSLWRRFSDSRSMDWFISSFLRSSSWARGLVAVLSRRVVIVFSSFLVFRLAMIVNHGVWRVFRFEDSCSLMGAFGACDFAVATRYPSALIMVNCLEVFWKWSVQIRTTEYGSSLFSESYSTSGTTGIFQLLPVKFRFHYSARYMRTK